MREPNYPGAQMSCKTESPTVSTVGASRRTVVLMHRWHGSRSQEQQAGRGNGNQAIKHAKSHFMMNHAVERDKPIPDAIRNGRMRLIFEVEVYQSSRGFLQTHVSTSQEARAQDQIE